MSALTKRQKSSDAYRLLRGTCLATLYFPSNDKSIECTNCGQRHEKSLLKNVAELARSSSVCKLISPILTNYRMDKKLGKTIPLKDMGKGEVFNCGQILCDRVFLIEEENLDVIGYGKDQSGSIHYLDDTLNDIRCCNDNETRLIPIHVDGDGHCLVYAISRALVGRELFWHALRVNLGLHIRDNLASYKQLFKDFIDAEDWEDIIYECDPYYIPPEGVPIGLRNIHIFGLANVLHRPIILLDCKSGMQSPGDYSGVFVPGFVSPEDCRGKDGTLNKPLCIAWSSSGRNHYIPLVGIKGRGSAMLPAYMVQTAWGMPDEYIKNYLELDNMDRCVVGGDKCLPDRYIRQLVAAMEEVFIEQNQVHPGLVADVHQFMYKSSASVQPDEVIQRTRQSMRDEDNIHLDGDENLTSTMSSAGEGMLVDLLENEVRRFLKRHYYNMHLDGEGMLVDLLENEDKACDSIPDSRSTSSEYKPDEKWEVQRKKQAAAMECHKGNDYFKREDYDNAIECYTKGAELDPANPTLPANRANALLKQRKYPAAEIDCTVCLTLDPLDTEAYLLRGAARMYLRKFAASKEDYEMVLQLEPQNKEAKFELEMLQNPEMYRSMMENPSWQDIIESPSVEQMMETPFPQQMLENPVVLQQMMENPLAQQMLENPVVLQQMMGNPFVQKMLENPVVVQHMMESVQNILENPLVVAQQMMEMMENFRKPGITHILNNPELMRQCETCDSIPDSRSSSYETDEELEVETKKQAAVMENDKCETCDSIPDSRLSSYETDEELEVETKKQAAVMENDKCETCDSIPDSRSSSYETDEELEVETKKQAAVMENDKCETCDSIPDSRSSSYETDEELEVETKKQAAVMENDKCETCDSIPDSRSSSYETDEELEVETKKQAAVMENDKCETYDSIPDSRSSSYETDEELEVETKKQAAVMENDKDEESLNNKLCTFTITQKEFMDQRWSRSHVDNEGVCTVCAKVCHKDHDLTYAKFSSFYCDCGAKDDGSCKLSTMDDKYPTLSSHLWDILDGIGLSEDRRQTSSKACITLGIIYTLLQQLTGRELVEYVFGSSVEATTTRDLGSDIDIVFCNERPHVVDDILDAPASGECFLLVPDDEFAGYAKLQSVLDGTPMTGDGTARQINSLFNIDNDGRVVRNQEIKPKADYDERCGPARTYQNTRAGVPVDEVWAYRCLTWPEFATEWLTRDRPYNWPPKDQIEKLRLLGCLVVGVGHPFRPEKFLQWRISFSLQERDLMLKLNAVQYRCYVLMKFTKRDIMKPEIEDAITSYHCKTVLFYAIETTPAKFWEPQNLVKCFLYCLERLFKCVENCFCPNYFIPESNLFHRRLHGNLELRRRISSMLQKLLREKGRFLFDIRCEDIGIQLSAAFNPLEQASTITSMSMKYAKITKDIRYRQFLTAGSRITEEVYILVIDAATDNDTTAAMKRLKYHIEQLDNTTRVTGYTVEQTREVVHDMLPFLHTVLASHMAADLLSSANRTVEAGSIRGPLDEHVQVSIDSGIIACRLKVAGIHYMLGEYETSERILSDVAYEFDTRSVVTNFCECDKSGRYTQNDVLYNKITSGELSCRDVVNSCLSYCIRFLPTEMGVTPTALKYELFKSTGTLEDTRTQMKSEWYEWGIVDGSVLLRYLQYLVYGKLGDVQRQRQAVETLENLALTVTDATLYHRETAFNILGWIYKHKGDVNNAARCLLDSIRIRPVHNAAKWHIGDLYLRQAMAASQCPDTTVMPYFAVSPAGDGDADGDLYLSGGGLAAFLVVAVAGFLVTGFLAGWQ